MAYQLDERALTLVTMSELAPLRLAPATSGLPAGAHAMYRGRVGSNLAVLTSEGLPVLGDGSAYQAWVREGDHWTSLGTLTITADSNGTAHLVAENSALVSAPDAIEISIESAGGSQTPSDTVVLRWLPA